MKIASLNPALSDLVLHFGGGELLRIVTNQCEYPAELTPPERVTAQVEVLDVENVSGVVKALLPLRDKLREHGVDTILLMLSTSKGDMESGLVALNQSLSTEIGSPIRVVGYDCRTLELILNSIERVAGTLGQKARGVAMSHNVKAQGMNWGDNFYERTKGKRISVIVSDQPYRLGGLWFPDVVKLASAHSQLETAGVEHRVVRWEEIVAYRPDVIIFAPQGRSLQESMSCFKVLEKLPNWDEIPAVKRGEVVFLAGDRSFFYPNQRLIDGMSYIFSAIAGFDSGYITERDSFRRLRWLELQRHKL